MFRRQSEWILIDRILYHLYKNSFISFKILDNYTNLKHKRGFESGSNRFLEYPLTPLGFLKHKSKQISIINSSKVTNLEDEKETKKTKFIFVINVIYSSELLFLGCYTSYIIIAYRDYFQSHLLTIFDHVLLGLIIQRIEHV